MYNLGTTVPTICTFYTHYNYIFWITAIAVFHYFMDFWIDLKSKRIEGAL